MISILCATKRPFGFARLVKSIFDLADNPDDLQIIAGLDLKDDPTPYMLIAACRRTNQFSITGEECTGVCENLNKIVRFAKGDHVLFVADDTEFRTKGWDTKMLSYTTADGIYCVFPSVHKGVWDCCHAMIGRQWIETLGWVMHPTFRHYYSDSFIDEVAKKLGRKIPARGVLLEHLHNEDELNAKNMARYREDSIKWNDPVMRKEINRAADQLREVMK